MQEEIIKTIKYFSFFQYPATLEEIHCFLRQKISKKRLKLALSHLTKKRILNSELLILNSPRYTLPQYGKKSPLLPPKAGFAGQAKIKNSKEKIKKIQLYIKLISLFPQIKLVGLSGTVAMMNAKKNDDIDLFVITAKNRLWTGRFIAVILAQILGLRRPRTARAAPNKVCLNLFFDENNMEVPKLKKTEYVAHEILQMKPMIDKDSTHQHFLRANRWVFRLFPNALSIKSKLQNSLTRCAPRSPEYSGRSGVNFLMNNKVAGLLENVLKRLQLNIIKLHRTNEIVTSTQLWFFPKDFEQDLRSKKLTSPFAFKK